MWDSLMNTKEKYTGFSLRGSLWEEGFVGKGPRLLGLIPQSISTFIFGTGSH